MPLPLDHPYYEAAPTVTDKIDLWVDLGGSNGPVGGGTATNDAADEEQHIDTNRNLLYKHNDTIVGYSSPANEQSVTTYDKLDETGRYNRVGRLSELMRLETGNKVCAVTGGQSSTALNDVNNGWLSATTQTQVNDLISAAEAKAGSRAKFVVVNLLGKDTTFANATGANLLAKLEEWITNLRTARGWDIPIFVIGLGPTPPTSTNYPTWDDIRDETAKITMDKVFYVKTDDWDYATYIHDKQSDGTTPDEVHWNAKGHNRIADAVYRLARLHGVISGAKRIDLNLYNMGDSTSDQGSNPGIWESLGHQISLMAFTNRYNYTDANNFGLSSDDTGEMLVRNPNLVAALKTVPLTEGAVVTFLSRANDGSAQRDAAWSIANIELMFQTWQAEGAIIYAYECLPRTEQDFLNRGFTQAQIDEVYAQDALVNAFMRDYPNVIFIEYADKYNANINDVTYDGLHPDAFGSFIIAEAGEEATTPRFGYRGFRLHDNNILNTIDLSGTTVDYDEALGSGTEAGADHLAQVDTDYDGDTAWYQVEIGFPDIDSDDVRTMDVQLRTNNGRLTSGYDRHNDVNQFPMRAYYDWCARKGRNIIVTTPVGTVPSSTYLRGRVLVQVNTTSTAASGSISLHNQQLVVIPA